jgi:hypothetical protein
MASVEVCDTSVDKAKVNAVPLAVTALKPPLKPPANSTVKRNPLSLTEKRLPSPVELCPLIVAVASLPAPQPATVKVPDVAATSIVSSLP